MTPATVDDLTFRTLEMRAERITSDNNVVLLLAQQINENNRLIAELIQYQRSKSVHTDTVKSNGDGK